MILAGGAGRRIGGDKPMKRLAGKRLVEHSLDRVRAWGLPFAVAVRDLKNAAFASGLPLLADEEGEGPIAGVASALRHSERNGWDAVLTIPCDTPFLPLDLPERLAAALGPPSLAAVASSGGRSHPSCALWHVGCAGKLSGYLEEGSSLMGFARALNARMVDWPVEPADPFFNINSEEDLAIAEHMRAGGGAR